MAITLNFNSLVSRFNDGLAHKKRRELYETLKSTKLLGKVMTRNEQNLIRPYLFETQNSRYWYELPLFETHNLGELEEARVHRYIDELMEGRISSNNPIYPRARDQKTRQFLSLLREMDERIELHELSKDRPEFSLGLLPCSWACLKKLRNAYPSATNLDYLVGVTEAEFKAKGIRNPAARELARYVSEQVKKSCRPAMVRRLNAAEAAGQGTLAF